MKPRRQKNDHPSLWRRYFTLTREEFWMLVLIIGLFTVGLIARQIHLHGAAEPPPATATTD